LLDLEVGLIKCCGANASQSFIVKKKCKLNTFKIFCVYILTDAKIKIPKNRSNARVFIYKNKFTTLVDYEKAGLGETSIIARALQRDKSE
jgi:hypothetical protein